MTLHMRKAMSTNTYPPFAQKIISKLRRYEE
ncbi:hypothetical protein SAMN05216605_121135 [Pseudomonas abietaniphila]|uniref:Uncharacterized protein n=1 Tax=Pseudomonas abietaniphila TaxID=89065 RepID=A0A1G8R1M4_9PSED|nr:hypothetical protein SAMN05216605_121135 [Pseudomonas abietaniphila]